MKGTEVIQLLEQQFPKELAYDWDNVGLLIGDAKKEIRTIYVAVDATKEVVEAAAAAGADLLLTHHPMIFKGMKKITQEDFIGNRVIDLIRGNINLYAMHTNFDVAAMADQAAEAMGLEHTVPLQKTGVKTTDIMQMHNKEEAIGIGKVGTLPRAGSLQDCIQLVKEAFGLSLVKVFTGEEVPAQIQTVAICPGSGKSVIEDALRAGAQVLITGDIDHHEGIDAVARGMAIVDAGHYGLEKLFVPYMCAYLKEHLEGIRILGHPEKMPFSYI